MPVISCHFFNRRLPIKYLPNVGLMGPKCVKKKRSRRSCSFDNKFDSFHYCKELSCKVLISSPVNDNHCILSSLW